MQRQLQMTKEVAIKRLIYSQTMTYYTTLNYKTLYYTYSTYSINTGFVAYTSFGA